MPIKLVVGLGNPGKKYEKTRHNIGYRVAHLLREDHSLPEEAVFQLQPPFLMNEHGIPVGELARYKRMSPAEILVVMDDFSIPLGTLRLRPGGSSGGHNGLKSILETFAITAVPRLRIGIGPVPEGEDPKDFVLRSFTKEEETKVRLDIIPRAAEAARRTVQEGLEKAMNEFNAPPQYESQRRHADVRHRSAAERDSS